MAQSRTKNGRRANLRLFLLQDLGGQTSIRPYWRCYYANTAAVIFVVERRQWGNNHPHQSIRGVKRHASAPTHKQYICTYYNGSLFTALVSFHTSSLLWSLHFLLCYFAHHFPPPPFLYGPFFSSFFLFCCVLAAADQTAMSSVLFWLHPRNAEAKALADVNPDFHGQPRGGITPLVFSSSRPSKTAGRLATFGRHENCDIRLPSICPSERYHNHHFFFFLAPSGELILRDETRGRTSIELLDATAADQSLYQLQGDSPRQRVIPRAGQHMLVVFGSYTTFLFVWGPSSKADLAEDARRLAVPGMTITSPESELEVTQRYELRSRYTPTVQSRSKRDKKCHFYHKLGEGTFGVVSKAVDLRTGEIWAVKEIKAVKFHPDYLLTIVHRTWTDQYIERRGRDQLAETWHGFECIG